MYTVYRPLVLPEDDMDLFVSPQGRSPIDREKRNGKRKGRGWHRKRWKKMGNTHDTEIARIEADHIQTKWKTTEDYRWGYTGDRGKSASYLDR